MFCTSLRRRASMTGLVPPLLLEPLNLRESQLQTHDIEVALPFAIDATTSNPAMSRILRVLVFSPASVRTAQIQSTARRIRHFAALSGGQDIAIVFLLQPPPVTTFTSAKAIAKNNDNGGTPDLEGTLAYAQLLAKIFELPDVPHIPILPLSDAGGLSQLLTVHVESMTLAPTSGKTPISTFELLRLCSLHPPMPDHVAYIITDLFADLREFACACASATSKPAHHQLSRNTSSSTYSVDPRVHPNGMREKLVRLRDLLGEDEYRNVVAFWAENVVVN